MIWVAALMICICILSATSMVYPSAANDDIVIRSQAEKLVQPLSKTPQLGDFGSIEHWLLKRLRSPGKTATA